MRGKLGEDPEAWIYVGILPIVARYPQRMEVQQVRMIIERVGLGDLGGIAAGVTIEDRGFRTRAFAHVPNLGWDGAAPVTKAELTAVPGDMLAFGMGPLNLAGWYDRAMGWVRMAGPEVTSDVLNGVAAVNGFFGMDIRQEVLPIFGDRHLYFVAEPGSPAGGGTAFFLKLRNEKEAADKLTRLCSAIVDGIHAAAGPKADAMVRLKKLERPNLMQIYAQSILPAAVTPNIIVTKGWVTLTISARAGLRKTRYLLSPQRSILERPDFAAIMKKMPERYHSIGYTDVGSCFGNAIFLVQVATDIGIMAVKIAATQGELPQFARPAELWPMDPGRFPDERVFREKLFGAASVIVYEPDGIL